MIKKLLKPLVLLTLLGGCGELALLSSGTGVIVSQNSYAKIYNGLDLATSLTTKKDIKTHAYNYILEAKRIKNLVFQKNILHDFDNLNPDVVISYKIIVSELYQPDKGFFKVKNMENYRPYIKEFHTTKKQNYIMAYGGQI